MIPRIQRAIDNHDVAIALAKNWLGIEQSLLRDEQKTADAWAKSGALTLTKLNRHSCR